MHTHPHAAKPLHGWITLSLRPRGTHAGLRAAAARCGARTLALSPFAVEARDDAGTRAALKQALAADIVLFTSPNAVRAAAAMDALKSRRGQLWLCVGASTQRALRRNGVIAAAPVRMDSEGLLAMPELAQITGQRIGLVTAPGGRGLLAPTLLARGANVLRADVYARVPIPLSAQALRKLDDALASPRRVVLALSSEEALQRLLSLLPTSLPTQLRKVAVIAASDRLATAAGAAGFSRIAIAANARPAALLHAAVDAFV